MAPFPETEIMTIKRIEVAIRKMDLKLLKDGAYKLHEKFHSGFRFEYLDVLKEIKEEVSANEEITQDIKGILIPTIDDILEQNGFNSSYAQNKVSSLTSLSYNSDIENNANTQTITKQEEQPVEQPKINAFSAFGTNPHATIQTRTFTQSPFCAEPFKEFSKTTIEIKQEPYEQDVQIQEPVMTQPTVNQPVEVQQAVQEIKQEQYQEQTVQNQQTENNYVAQSPQEEKTPDVEVKNETKEVAIFYHLNNSNEKIRNIERYRELINKNDTNLSEIISLISEINTQSNVNVSELKTILEQLTMKNNKVSLVTNSSSRNFVELLNSANIDFDIFEQNTDKNLNILPFLGMTNLFVCKECKQEFLEENNILNSIILQCPKCKNAMFPSLYALGRDSISQINVEYYNSSLIALASAKVWLIIHPQLEDKTEMNMLKSALKMSNKTQSVFIVDKDINVRENCKKMLLEINENLKINTQISVIEDFFNAVH